MIKKILLIGVLLLGSMSLQAQEVNETKMAGASTVKLSEKLLRKCDKLMEDAQWYLKRKEFGKAKAKLEELLAINPKDAQAKVLLEQCEQNAVTYGESADEKPNKFSFGLTVGMDFFKLNYGVHVGFTARYGHYTDLVNVTAGVEYEAQQSYHGRGEFMGEYDSSVTLGGQLIIPVLVKFNLAKCTETTRFYAGAGAEAGLKLYTKDFNVYTYNPSLPIMNSTTVAGLVQVGVTGRHFDVGLYYRRYFNNLVNDKFKDYQENDRVGFTATYYF